VNDRTSEILARICAAGYLVSRLECPGAVEFRAVNLDNPAADVQTARCTDGDGEPEVYRAAELLARALGVDATGA
jgi:hypothetical protein